jgi:hypothetical protein
MLLKSIDNIEITSHDGFLLIEADPKKFKTHALVDFKSFDRVDEEVHKAQKEAEEPKRDAFHELSV